LAGSGSLGMMLLQLVPGLGFTGAILAGVACWDPWRLASLLAQSFFLGEKLKKSPYALWANSTLSYLPSRVYLHKGHSFLGAAAV
jgi:hypothetical protein